MWIKYLNLKKPSINRDVCLKAIIIGGLLYCSLIANAQFHHESLIKTDASFFTIDPLDNIFLSESGAIIKIYESTGKKKYFSNPMYGTFDIIDSSDPLNILAFSNDLGIITFLDKNLVEKESFTTHDNFFSEKPELACNSRLEGFWVYYPENRQIRRINRKKQVLTVTPSINSLEYNFSQPCFMIEADSRLYISDKENGIFVFDIFGGFLFRLPLKNVCTFQVIDNYIIYFTKKHLCLYDFFLHEEKFFVLPENKTKMGIIRQPYIYVLTKEGINKYFVNIDLF